MIDQHEAEIRANLEAHKRPFGDVEGYLPGNMADFALWAIPRVGAVSRKTIKLAYEPRAEASGW